MRRAENLADCGCRQTDRLSAARQAASDRGHKNELGPKMAGFVLVTPASEAECFPEWVDVTKAQIRQTADATAFRSADWRSGRSSSIRIFGDVADPSHPHGAPCRL